MIKFKHTGDFNKTTKYLKRIKNIKIENILMKYGALGVKILASMTPKDSGDTANAWDYYVLKNRNGFKLCWTNHNVSDGIPIVILLQYGHATKDGRFIEGIDFINPGMSIIFEDLIKELSMEVHNV